MSAFAHSSGVNTPSLPTNNNSGEPIQLLGASRGGGHEAEVQCVALGSTSERLVVSGGAEGSCRVWDLRGPGIRAVRRLGDLRAREKYAASGAIGYQAVTWDRHENFVFAARGPHVEMYDLRKSNAILLSTADSICLDVCPQRPREVGEEEEEEEEEEEGPDEVNSLSVNAMTGDVVASRDDGRISVLSFDNAVVETLWESPASQSHENICAAASWTESQEIISGGLDSNLKCWSLFGAEGESDDESDAIIWETAAEVYQPSARDSASDSACVSGAWAFNPPFVYTLAVAAQRMAVGMGDGTVGYWDLGDVEDEDGGVTEWCRFPAHRAGLVKVVLCDQGHKFFSVGNDREISLWRSPEFAGERPVRMAWRQHTHKPNDCCAPQDGSFLILATTQGFLTKFNGLI